MSEKLINEQTNIDTTGLKDVSEGFSQIVTANNQNKSNVQEKGFSGVIDANKQNTEHNATTSDKSGETK